MVSVELAVYDTDLEGKCIACSCFDQYHTQPHILLEDKEEFIRNYARYKRNDILCEFKEVSDFKWELHLSCDEESPKRKFAGSACDYHFRLFYKVRPNGWTDHPGIEHDVVSSDTESERVERETGSEKECGDA